MALVKTPYDLQTIPNLASYVASQTNVDETVTGLASSFVPDYTALNVFTGTLAMGNDLAQQYYNQMAEGMSFTTSFQQVVKMYEQQAEFAKQDAQAIIDKEWEQARIQTEVAAFQAGGTLAEQQTLGTGRMAIGEARLEKQVSEARLQIDQAAADQLLDVFTEIDSTIGKLIQSSSEEYQKFITQANAIEAEMWQFFLKQNASKYGNLLVNTETNEQIYTNWQDALLKIGAIDETGEYTEYGKLLAQLMLNPAPGEHTEFLTYLQTSENKDFWYANNQFLRKEYFGIKDWSFDMTANSRLYELSGFRLGAPEGQVVSLEKLSGEGRTTAEKRYIQKAIDTFGEQFVYREKLFGGYDKSKAPEVKTMYEMGLNESMRNAVLSGEIKEGTLIKHNNYAWVYAGDGVFVREYSRDSKFMNIIFGERRGSTQAGGEPVKTDRLEYSEANLAQLKSEYKYVYQNTYDGRTDLIGTNTYGGPIGSDYAGNISYKRIV